MSSNRPSLIAGLFLIALGIIFLITYFFPGAWPVLLIGLGVLFLIIAVMRRTGWPVITGLVNITLGCILLYQTITQHWMSWYFLWPLIFASVGLGMVITRRLDHYPHDIRGARYLKVSWGWLALGILGSVILYVFRPQISWPSIVWGMGGLFILVGLFSGVGPLFIPGIILGGLGLLLSFQNSTGAWDSWAYTWALLPAFTGLGMFLAFMRHRIMRIVSLSILGWSLLLFLVFGLFFAGDGVFLRFWPVALILLGFIVLIQSMIVRRPASKQIE